MNQSIKKCLPAVVGISLLTAIDLLTKLWAESTLQKGPIVLIPGVFELRYLENRGAAFGILQNRQWFFYVITVLFLVIIGYVYHRMPQKRHYLLLKLIVIVLSAGAIGNFVDRLTLHYVRDFLYISLIDFPIFNVADIYVTCASAGLFLSVLFVYRDEDFDFLTRKGQHE